MDNIAEMFRKPVQVSMTFPFVRCGKALDALPLKDKIEIWQN
jgi:hypothetical protein